MKWLLLLFIIPAQAQLTGTPQNFTSSPCTDRNHIFLIPGALTAGGSSRACVSRFYPEGAAKMTLTLTVDGETVTAARDLPPGDGGCLDIAVPQRPNSKAEVYVNIRYKQCSWDRHTSVRVSSGRVVVVHTERVRYRPGEVLRLRALVLKADLTPAHTPIEEIWLEGPGGAWARWLRLRTRLGLAQAQHALDERAPPGRWSVHARLADGAQGSSSFMVGNYEVPPFQLTVRHSPRILRTSERLVWTVCVRYPWSEAVEGMLVIRLRGAGGSGGSGIRTAVRLKAPRACHRHAAAAKRIGLNGDHPPDVIIADFSFEEEGTRVWQNTTVVSRVVDEAVTLEFLTEHRVPASPGLPYKIKIRATRWDDRPAAGERVNVCSSPASSVSSDFNSADSRCADATTDGEGVARITFNADDGPYYNLQASLNGTLARTLVWVAGAGGASLGALRARGPGAALLPLYTRRTSRSPLTVHFVVITRGGILYRWGATTQCPVTGPTDEIVTAPRNSICPNTNLFSIEQFFNNNLVSNSSELDSLFDRHLSKVMLPIKVSPQMCPESHLVAYFYHNDELITASKHFEMEDCFANKAEATWIPRLVAPGSTATLQVTTPGPALCALTVLETASKWTEYESVRSLVMNGLRRLIDSHRNITEHDAAGKCFFSTDGPKLSSSRDLLSRWLATAGVRLLGDQPRTCETPAPMMDDVVPRSDFSESWLWKLSPVGAAGAVSVSARAPQAVTRYEAAALCISRSGLAAAPPALLQVFREVFIHATGPRRVRRGDSIVIPYRVFNYLYTPHAVAIQISTKHQIQGVSTSEVVCLSARASTARRLTIACRETDALSILVTSVRDPNCTTEYRGFRDEVVLDIRVDPEGVPVEETKSALLCGADSVNFTSTSEITWSWSSVQTVPGTESLTVWTTTDLMGPLMAHADGLVRLPRGCGEQNMARLATALLALRLLDPRAPLALHTRDLVARGFNRQLQYAHAGGGFSAFGGDDPSPSTWLTAFCLRYMKRAHETISGPGPLPPALELSRRWLLDQQLENGCFRNTGHVFHHLLKGGLDERGEISNVALTAYVITSLIESFVPYKILNDSLPCLRALPPIKTNSNSRVYARALITYAFMKLRKYEESGNDTLTGSLEDDYLRELKELLRIAKRSGDFVWWETGNLATSIEATGYALLSLGGCPPAAATECARCAAGALRWLSARRDRTGGFLSTQDTLVALEGMSLMSPLPTGVSVTLNAGGESRKVTPQAIPEIERLPVGTLKVTVEGPGCALVQATRSYHTLEPQLTPSEPHEHEPHEHEPHEHEPQLEHSLEPPTALAVNTHVQTDGPFDCVNDVCFCAAVVQVCAWWRGSLPAMSLLSVTMPTGYAPSATHLYSQLNNDTLLRRIEISSSSNKVSLYLGTRDGSDTTRDGQECYKLHVVGPRVRTKPAYAEIIDYYQPQVKDTQMYTIPEDCPPRIAHDDSSKYLPSDNLFSKAKSLIDSDEIVISYEYTPEDLPEGIPLEDPIYDNLTKIKKYIDDKRLIKGDELSETSKPTELQQIKFGNTIDYRTRIDEKRIVKASSNNTSNSQIGIGKLDTSYQNTTNEKKQLNHMNSRNEINNKIKHNIKIRDEYIEMSKNDKEYDDQNKALHTSEPKLSVDNPILSAFHVIDSDQDFQVPTGMEGPVPAVVLPPPDFLARHMGLAAPSYYKWAENPAPSFSPQYLRENDYGRSYLYDAATSRK